MEANKNVLAAAKLRTGGAQKAAKEAYDAEVTRQLLYINQYVLVQVFNRTKFQSKFLGPFKIVDKGIYDTYKLMGPDMTLVKALVHRDRLKLVTSDTNTDRWWYNPTNDRETS